MDESTRNGRLAELLGHPVQISLHCGCTKVSAGPVEYFIKLLGPKATIASAESRMICETCRQRPRAVLAWEWAAHPIRRHGAGKPPPEWCTID